MKGKCEHCGSMRFQDHLDLHVSYLRAGESQCTSPESIETNFRVLSTEVVTTHCFVSAKYLPYQSEGS